MGVFNFLDEFADAVQESFEEFRHWVDKFRGVNRRIGNLQLGFLDAGMVVELNALDHRNLVELFRAVCENNGEVVGRLLIDRSRYPEAVQDAETFKKGITTLVQRVHDSGLVLGKMGVSHLLHEVLTLCYKHQVKIESRYATVIVAMGVVEGIGRQLDPDVDILRQAAPYILRAAASGVA